MDKPSEKQSQVNAGFRLPVELVEWLDKYADYLSKYNGYTVSRTQALISIINEVRPKKDEKIKIQRNAVRLGFSGAEEFEHWHEGVRTIKNYLINNWDNQKFASIHWSEFDWGAFWNFFMTDSKAKAAAIDLGDGLAIEFFSNLKPGTGMLTGGIDIREKEYSEGLRALEKIGNKSKEK